MNEEHINETIKTTITYINDFLLPIVRECHEDLEGHLFTCDNFINKVQNLTTLVSDTKNKQVMEIGFNAGFSAALILFSNPDVHLTCLDLGIHKYVYPCYKKMKETFGDRIEIIIGDSTITLPFLLNRQYDLIHIDGGHTSEVALSDIHNSYRLSKNETILIMDDYDYPHIRTLWDEFVFSNNLRCVENVRETEYHDIKCVVK
jgi:predicted O-methyltransferase YrrM